MSAAMAQDYRIKNKRSCIKAFILSCRMTTRYKSTLKQPLDFKSFRIISPASTR